MNSILLKAKRIVFSKVDMIEYFSYSVQNQCFSLGSGRVKTHLGTARKQQASGTIMKAPSQQTDKSSCPQRRFRLMEVTGVGRKLSKSFHLWFVSSCDFLFLLLQKAGYLSCDNYLVQKAKVFVKIHRPF